MTSDLLSKLNNTVDSFTQRESYKSQKSIFIFIFIIFILSDFPNIYKLMPLIFVRDVEIKET